MTEFLYFDWPFKPFFSIHLWHHLVLHLVILNDSQKIVLCCALLKMNKLGITNIRVGFYLPCNITSLKTDPPTYNISYQIKISGQMRSAFMENPYAFTMTACNRILSHLGTQGRDYAIQPCFVPYILWCEIFHDDDRL